MLVKLMTQIEDCLPEGGEWCTVEKAQTLAAMVVALRPSTIVEIGVWMGGSLIPMCLAAITFNPSPTIIAIDPWSPGESVKGQSSADANWWKQADHEKAYQVFVKRLEKHSLQNTVKVWRMPSDQAPDVPNIDLLHIDGNHSDQALRDVEHYSPFVNVGGLVILDDIGWTGGGVEKAKEALLRFGYRQLYTLGSGAVFRREA